MAFVKKCNPGKITMDLPRSSYIYELPLLSFADIHGDVNLSLIFNYQMKYENLNPFFIKEGYKLNIHKMLIFEGGIPVSLMEGNGRLVNVYGDDWPYSFHDGSQRFIRQTGMTSKPYAIENADCSKEYYNSNGMIVSVVDKYGTEILNYTYNITYGRLASICYRNSKTIQFAYNNSKLSTITYSGSGCTTTLTYPTAGVTVQHHAGETFNLELSNTMDFSATAVGANYAVKAKKTSDFSIALSDYIGGQVVNTTTYGFYYTVDGCTSHSYVEITNNEGVKTRCEYWQNQLAYSYEVAGTDVSFVNNRFAGSVQINKTMENPYSSGAFGTQNRWDGVQMTFNGSVSPNEWYFDVNAYATSGVAGYYVLTGWTKLLNNGDASIRIAGLTNGYQYSYDPGSDLDGKWKFFAYRFYADAAYIRAYLPSASLLETKDFRLTFQKTHVIANSDASKIAVKEEVLIYPVEDDMVYIPIHESEFIFDETNVSAYSTVTLKDLLKYRINQKKGQYLGEIYINGCCEAVQLSSSGGFTVKHTDPVTQDVTYYNLDDCYLGMRQYVENKMVTTLIKDESDNFLHYETENEARTVVAYKYYNEYMDVIEEKVDGVTTTYTRNNDLVTATTVSDGSNSYTRETTYGTNTDGNPTITTKDEFGNTALYTLDSTWGVVKSVMRSGNTVLTDTYDDDMCALTKRAFGNTSGRSNTIAYSNGNISTLATGSLSYDFTYTKGKLTAVNKNDTRVEEHVHTGNTGTDSYYPTQASALHSTEATFDKYGRLLNIDGVLTNVYDIAPTFSSSTGNMTVVGNNGSAFLAKTTDEIRGEVARFTYDQYNRVLTKKEVTSSSDFATKVSKETFTYDDINRMTKDVCIYDQPNSKQVTSTITYATTATNPLADERVGTYNYAVKNSSTAKTKNTFDDFKRVKKKVYTIAGKAYTKTLTYNKTRISKETDSAGITNTYTYDSLGRISKIVSDGKTTTYHYDTYGQLVRENNQALDATFVYAYNTIGNLTSIKKYAYIASTSSPSGSYTTTSFGYTADKLTTFGGATIAYNTMGCPTTYEGKTATWSKGKLARLSSGTLATGMSSHAYTYNAYGRRVTKAYTYMPGSSSAVQTGELTGCNKTYYYDHAGRLISETVSKTHYGADGTSESIVFLYDESGIVGMVHTVGGTASTYYFHRNLLGDVVAIYDTSGNMVAKYLYDAFGNCTVSSETTNTVVANANPIRYRGYYYDDDTGLYYCNARYYSPKWRRFISPDDTAYLDPESVNGLNLYCYCNNDPVNYCDPSGHFVLSTFLICLGVGVVAGAGLGALSAAQQGTDIWRGMLTGALLGGMIGAAAGLALAGASGGVAAGVGKAFLKAGTKTIAGKFTADLTAYAAFGKEMGSLESYMSAFVFGGSVGALGLSGFWKGAADIMARPAYSILVDDMLFKGKGWSQEKYWTNVAIRGMTYGLPTDLKPITRGLLNGWYNKYNFAIPSNLAYAI